MIPQLVVQQSEKAGAQYMYNKGALQSVKPAETMFGYSFWSHLIPPFKPEHSLLLGYGTGSSADLMRKIWGTCKITGVDIEARNDRYVEYRMKIMDAYDFVKDCTKDTFFKGKIPLLGEKARFDYISIDLWDGDTVPAFVFDVEFVVRLREIATGLISMNIKSIDVPRCRAYFDYGFKFDRSVAVEGNQVLWWSLEPK